MEIKIGFKYEKLIVLDIYRNNKNRTEVKCLCECGNIYHTLLSYFKLGKNKHCSECGKIQRKNSITKYYSNTSYINHHNYSGYKEIPLTFFNKFRINAEKRNIPFNINIEYLYDVFIKQDKKCYFTDIELNLSKKTCNASIDRINSNIGYEIDNIIWIYKPINFMKSDLDIIKFIDLCCLISDNIS